MEYGRTSSKSKKRQEFSANSAKIPFDLAAHIARSFKPLALPAKAG
jgi:hypothetical protein